jgi:uncharacterized membrane protein
MTVGSIGLLTVGRKVWWGWMVLIINEWLWVIYAVNTKQYGFIVAAAIYGTVYTINIMRWRADEAK